MVRKILGAMVLLLAFMASAPAFAALGAQTTWEVRPTVGSNTNGGAFRFGIGTTDVSGSATLVVDSSNNKKVTSSAHTFVSGDVGKYIRVTAGTGFVFGWYQIKSIEGPGAILDRTPAAVSTTGGTYSLYAAIDYSQQDAVNSTGSNISTTDAVANGTTTLTSATGAFTSALPGNIIYLAGGSGTLTGGWYEVASVTNATTIVLDRSVASGTGITMNIGGALSTLAPVVSNAVNNNQAFVKATGTLTTSAGYAFTQGTFTLKGYTTTRDDEGKATIQASAGSINLLSFSSGDFFVQNFIIDCNSQTTTKGINSTTTGAVINNVIQGCTVHGIYLTAGNGGVQIIAGNEIKNLVFGATANIELRSTSGNNYFGIYNNYIHDSYGTGIRAIDGTQFSAIVNNVVANVQGTGSIGIYAKRGIITNNTVYDTAEYSINIENVGSAPIIVQNNIFAKSAQGGIRFPSNARNTSMIDGNAYYDVNNLPYSGRNPNSEAFANSAYTIKNDIILTNDPFVNAASKNFALNSTGGGGGALRGSGKPSGYSGLTGTNTMDFGALQAAGAGGAGGSFVFGQ